MYQERPQDWSKAKPYRPVDATPSAKRRARTLADTWYASGGYDRLALIDKIAVALDKEHEKTVYEMVIRSIIVSGMILGLMFFAR
jgi:hypothetical protein